MHLDQLLDWIDIKPFVLETIVESGPDLFIKTQSVHIGLAVL